MSYKTYDGYKDSEIDIVGLIPNSYRITRLKFLCDINTGDKDTVDNNPNGKYPFYVRSPIIERINTYSFDGEAILMAGDGVGAGKVFHYINGKFDYHQRVYNLHYFNNIFPKFLYYYMSSLFSIEINKGSAKSTVDSIRLPMLENFLICYPNINEQKQIANYLDKKTSKIDTTIAKNKELINLLEEKRTALINQVVTKGLNPEVPMKDSGIEWIGEINNNFNITRIKFCSEIYGRIGFRGYTVADIVDEGEGAITLSPSNINNQKFDISDKKYLSWKKYEESPEIKIFNNDVIFVKTGSSVGKTCIIKNLHEKATINPQLIVFKNININNEYLYYVLTSNIVQYQVSLNLKGGTIPTLTQEDIQNYFITLPDTDTQNQIVDFLNQESLTIDKTITKIKENINLLEEYKTSLIHHVVTGKIDVRGEEI